ncbi:hypothetical protein L204_104435 [Cryptococcus depauperatus]|nr:hypothetical protein L204_03298 [Cryptococcus depauperatus CBS 7855]
MSASESRRIALSDPHAVSPPRFVVGGQLSQMVSGDIKMYEWRKDEGKMAMLGFQTEVGQVRSLAWSPSPVYRHLLATGVSSGKTYIFNLSPSTLSLPMAATDVPQTVATLTVKHTRPVSSISFSTQDPNYLATGLERHRSDSSLLIWDIHDAVAASRIPVDGDPDWKRPEAHRLKTTMTSSFKSTSLSEPRPIQAYCPSEQITSVAFVPTVPHQLLASSSNKTIRLYDLRVPTHTTPREGANMAGSSAQWLTRACHGLSPNPTDQHLFASYESPPGQNNTVRLWDTRKPGTDVLNFEVLGHVLNLRWLDACRLGVGGREAGISIWDIVRYSSRHEEWVTLGGIREIVKPKHTLHSFTFSPPAQSGEADVMYVLRDGTISIGPVGFASVLSSSSRGDVAICTSSLTILDPDITLPRSKSDQPPASQPKDLDPIYRRNKFQLPPERITAILSQHSRSRSSSPAPSKFSRPVITDGANTKELAGDAMTKSFMSGDRDWYEHDNEDLINERGEILGGYEGWRKVLGGDVSVVMRRRAMEGYGLGNLLLNAAVASKHPGKYKLAGVWEFVDHLIRAMTPALSSSGGYSLAHLGIYPIWTSFGTMDIFSTPLSPDALREKLVLSQYGQDRRPSWPGSRSASVTRAGTFTPRERKASDRPLQDVDPDYISAIQSINEARAAVNEALVHPGTVHAGVSSSSSRNGLRKLILTVCGENGEGEKSEVERLIKQGEKSKAAFKAFFRGDESETVKILMTSEDQNDNLLGSTIAGFMSQSASARGSEYFNLHWRNLVRRVDDPHIRAILSRIGGEDWESVLEEESIPLLDRIAVAVQHLDDQEFSQFLRGRMNRFTRSASLHMLPLTGLAPPALSLLARYLARTGDLQTVTLLSAFSPPNKLNDAEKVMVERWRETYRDMLDSWAMWSERCDFDIKWGQLQRTLGSKEEDLSMSRCCPICNNPVSKDIEQRLHQKNTLRGTPSVGWPSERTTVCMYCQNPLPRCDICLLHVDPYRPPSDVLEDTAYINDTIDAAYVFCMTCRHGGHACHVLPWFEGDLDGLPPHVVCPVAGCDCECADI